jgi:hypothetical protein
MRTSLVGTVFFATLISACGGIVVFEPGGQGGGTIDDGWDDDGGDDGSVAVSASQSASATSGGGTPAIVPTIEVVKLGANCMPVVGPDPLGGTVAVRYDNQGTAEGSLELLQAAVIFSNPMEGWVFGIELEPGSSGTVEAGSSTLVEHAKVESPGDSSFVCQLCGQEGSLELRYGDGLGNEVTTYAPFELGCAF